MGRALLDRPSLHASGWLPSPIEVVVNVVVRDDNAVRAVIEGVVAEVVDRVVRENGVVREQAYGVAGSVDLPPVKETHLVLSRSGCSAPKSRCSASWRSTGLGPAVDVLRRGDDGLHIRK